ncbi:MAG: 7,8-didemethyl-8-hydroxy-5-deazariboflavin synthase subunit CofG, partial [Cyanobacteriota bacterium]|nr:7,8-didemethyl-8-hydroxy-5-deazariboflavin synthase subunit CofG [Cyanobacteriota bacterium]
TYSSAYTLVPTYECFNRCSYCNFRTDPGDSPWLSLADARQILESLQNGGTIEILILCGEVHPQSPRRKAWFDRIYNLCELALSLGFLPHTNAGPLTWEEMAKLKQVNISMGLMLEQTTPKLMETVHRRAPSKTPKIRQQQLEWAGEMQIPFTTGLLLGIGETPADWQETLEAIARVHHQWGHIQEVILQPHSLGGRQPWLGETFETAQLVRVVKLARQILPDEITLQIPPNLVATPEILLACLDAGARDLGGLGPRDEVNPDYAHPHPVRLAQVLAPHGWQLVRRLPVYPQYESWPSDRLQRAIASWQS